jgi:hypothetical protein
MGIQALVPVLALDAQFPNWTLIKVPVLELYEKLGPNLELGTPLRHHAPTGRKLFSARAGRIFAPSSRARTGTVPNWDPTYILAKFTHYHLGLD